MKEVPEIAEIAWEGDSLEVVRSFPKPVREGFGAELFRLQLGEQPLDSRPMKSIGAGVFELRDRDDAGWYRVIYLRKVENTIYVLHAFKKQSAKTSKRDLAVAEQRLKTVRERIREAKKRNEQDKNS